MKDLNSLYIFSQVVERNGFTGAARALGVARSSICRRVAQLEEELGVRLVQRSTRRFAVTELGMEFHSYCVKMVAEAQAGFEKMACAKAKPSGVIRMSCPAAVVQMLIGPFIPAFIAKNPEVRIAIESSNHRVDIDDKVDLSIRVRQIPTEDSRMVMRSLGIIQQVLVATRGYLERHGRPTSPTELDQFRTLSFGALQGPHYWTLVDQNEQEIQLRHDPTFIVDDLALIRQAVLQDLGIAQLPLASCLNEIRQGILEVVLPEYLAPLCEVQVLFPSRRGMLPSVRSFIDFLSEHCLSEVEAWQLKKHTGSGNRDNVRFWTHRVPQIEFAAVTKNGPNEDLAMSAA